MNRMTIGLLLAIAIISAIWLFNTFVLSERRRIELEDAWNELLSPKRKTYNDLALLHNRIQSINDLETWSWQFTTGLWMFTIVAFIIHILTK